jgi:hypothetical protein
MREQHAQREALDQLRELGKKHEASFQVIVLVCMATMQRATDISVDGRSLSFPDGSER